jgi:molecular chaperone GrpE (heat shock protein)
MSDQDNPKDHAADDNDPCEKVPEELDAYLDDFFSKDPDCIGPDHIAKRPEAVTDRLDQLADQVQQLQKKHKTYTTKFEDYFNIVAECQKETAKLANSRLERHLLHPAIEAVDMLARQIQQLLQQVTSLPDNEMLCPFVRPIADSIKHVAVIADDKSKSLGMEVIEPRGLDDLDPDKHEVKQVFPTEDSTKHKKIERTLVRGLMYRGKVLRQAKVSVYRYMETGNSKGEKNEGTQERQ